MNTRIIFLFAVAVFVGAAARAALVPTFSFDISDPWVEVGESFEVSVSLTGVDPSLGNLTGFGFLVDPNASLTKFAFQGATVGADFLDFTDPLNPSDVAGGLADPFGSTGSDIHLATLSFLALEVGSEWLDLSGALLDARGLFFATDDFSQFFDFPIDVSVRLASVPEPSTYGLFGAAALIGLIALRKRRARRAALSE